MSLESSLLLIVHLSELGISGPDLIDGGLSALWHKLLAGGGRACDYIGAILLTTAQNVLAISRHSQTSLSGRVDDVVVHDSGLDGCCALVVASRGQATVGFLASAIDVIDVEAALFTALNSKVRVLGDLHSQVVFVL